MHMFCCLPKLTHIHSVTHVSDLCCIFAESVERILFHFTFLHVDFLMVNAEKEKKRKLKEKEKKKGKGKGPDRNLKPNPKIKVQEKDPFFELR